MSAIETEAAEYVGWLQVHNYAETTVACRIRYLAYFAEFCDERGIERPEQVTLDLLQAYQQRLYDHRKRDGEPLAVATQAQRLVPVTHFFTWLRRSGRVELNPASDLLVLEDGRLVPLTFVSRDGEGILTVDGPPGLLDLE